VNVEDANDADENFSIYYKGIRSIWYWSRWSQI